MKLKNHELPTVSLCTPTYNRRPFIPYAIKCVLHQDYPKDKIEWVVVDDGSDKVEDLFLNNEDLKDINVKYFYYEEKMNLGKKRNLVHTKTTGDILIYMDDDDYYPPERISHAVEKLLENDKYLMAGSSKMYVWSSFHNKMFTLGPYRENHATAGTFAFKRELLEKTRYNDLSSIAEEKEFLKNNKIPVFQLDAEKVIVVFCHHQNTFDKRQILDQPGQFVKPLDKSLEDFIKDEELRNFYGGKYDSDIVNYDDGYINNKPDVVSELERRKTDPNLMMVNVKQYNGSNIAMPLSNLIESVPQFQKMIKDRDVEIEKLKLYVKTQTNIINCLRK